MAVAFVGAAVVTITFVECVYNEVRVTRSQNVGVKAVAFVEGYDGRNLSSHLSSCVIWAMWPCYPMKLSGWRG
jgi:hypothetical protein